MVFGMEDALLKGKTALCANQTTFAYNDTGELTRVMDPGGKHIDYTYNANGWRATMTDYDNGVTTYNYDTTGRLESLTNPFDETTTWECDTLGRPGKQTLGNSTYAEYT